MKHKVKVSVILVILLIALLYTLPAAAGDTYVVTTEIDPLLIHALPQGDVIGQIKKGEFVEVLSIDRAGWATVEYEGCTVYMYAGKGEDAYLKPADGCATPEPQPIPEVIKVTYTKDNLTSYRIVDTVKTEICARRGRSDLSKILARFKPGEEVLVVVEKYDDEWAKIILEDDQVAYVHRKYLVFDHYNLPEYGDLCTVRVEEAKSLQVYSSPDAKSDVLARVAVGSFVRKVETTEDGVWAKVFYSPTDYGYVRTKNLKNAE